MAGRRHPPVLRIAKYPGDWEYLLTSAPRFPRFAWVLRHLLAHSSKLFHLGIGQLGGVAVPNQFFRPVNIPSALPPNGYYNFERPVRRLVIVGDDLGFFALLINNPHHLQRFLSSRFTFPSTEFNAGENSSSQQDDQNSLTRAISFPQAVEVLDHFV